MMVKNLLMTVCLILSCPPQNGKNGKNGVDGTDKTPAGDGENGQDGFALRCSSEYGVELGCTSKEQERARKPRADRDHNPPNPDPECRGIRCSQKSL